MSLPYSGQFVAVTSYREKPMVQCMLSLKLHDRWDAVELTPFYSFYSTKTAAQLIQRRSDDVKKTKFMKLWDLLAHLEGPR